MFSKAANEYYIERQWLKSDFYTTQQWSHVFHRLKTANLGQIDSARRTILLDQFNHGNLNNSLYQQMCELAGLKFRRQADYRDKVEDSTAYTYNMLATAINDSAQVVSSLSNCASALFFDGETHEH